MSLLHKHVSTKDGTVNRVVLKQTQRRNDLLRYGIVRDASRTLDAPKNVTKVGSSHSRY